MRILHVVDKMDPKLGGVSQAVRTIICGLDGLFYLNEVVTLDSPGADFSKSDSFQIHALGPGITPWSYNPKLVPWLIKNMFRFDAVFVHGLWLYIGYGVHKAIKIAKEKNFTAIPHYYVMPHGMLDPYFQNAPGRKLKAIRNLFYWKLIEGKLINEANGLLFTCEEERRLANNTFKPYSPKKEMVSGLGVLEPPAYIPPMLKAFLTKCPQVANKPYLLFLSRIHEKKGVDILIKSYSEIWKNYPLNKNSYSSEPPLLVIAGPGIESEYGKKIKDYAEKNLPKDTVYFPGMLTGNEKWGAFYGCEAFVLPSHQENFGIAVVESLGCGKAVLISNQINISRDILKAGGGIVADDTLMGTIYLLETWINLSTEKKNEYSKKARDLYLNNYAVKATSMHLNTLLEKASTDV